MTVRASRAAHAGAALLLALAAAAPAGAGSLQGELVSDRPAFTLSAPTIPDGGLQIEMGYSYTQRGDDHRHALGELRFRLGLNDITELRVALNSYVLSRAGGADRNGVEDMTFGLKLNFLEGSGWLGAGAPAFSVLAEASSPTGASSLGPGEWQAGIRVLTTWNLTDQWIADLNVDYLRASDAGARFDQWSGGLKAIDVLGSRTAAFGELVLVSPRLPNGPDERTLGVGLLRLLSDDTQFDGHARFGIDEDSIDASLGMGLTLRW